MSGDALREGVKALADFYAGQEGQVFTSAAIARDVRALLSETAPAVEEGCTEDRQHVPVLMRLSGRRRGVENRCMTCGTSEPWPCQTRQAIDRAKP